MGLRRIYKIRLRDGLPNVHNVREELIIICVFNQEIRPSTYPSLKQLRKVPIHAMLLAASKA